MGITFFVDPFLDNIYTLLIEQTSEEYKVQATRVVRNKLTF